MRSKTVWAALSATFIAAAVIVLGACSQTQITTAASSPAGQLFCAIQTSGGGSIVAGLIDAEATAANPLAGQAAVMATGALKSQVDAECAAAGGVAVSPPVNPASAPVIAIVVPKAPALVTPAAPAPVVAPATPATN